MPFIMTAPRKIGRFEIQKVLGRGSQGVVYLARDPGLDRPVAVKTIRVSTADLKKHQTLLMREARLVGSLQHPNIISLYEAGEDRGLLYLVFEFVSGLSLTQHIRRQGPLKIRAAIDLMIQILSGIQHAHDRGIIHRDLSPSNILLDHGGMPRIMDFGISIVTGAEESLRKDVAGTPCYMSPEHFSKDPVTFQSDIFSLGLIFYEMVLGHPAVQAENYVAVMYKIAEKNLPPPSGENREIDRKLDAVFLRAVERNPEARYLSAASMLQDLESYLRKRWDEESHAWNGTSHSTLDFLLRRIRHKGDFPSFSQNIIEINKKASASRANMTSASELSNAILKDYALTNKLLRLVNSAFYGQFAGTVTTVSRAVVILGFEQVRMAASALLLFEHMSDNTHIGELKEEALHSFVSAMVAKDLAERMGFHSVEEAFICAMVHNLGRYLTLCYFPEEHAQILSLMASKGLAEAAAVRSVLGISYDDIGIGVARKWHFPSRIVESIRSIPEGKTTKPKNDQEMLQLISGFSNSLIEAVGAEEGGGKTNLEEVLSRFEESFPLSEKQIRILLSKTLERLAQFSEVLNVNIEQSRLVRRMTGSIQEKGPQKAAKGKDMKARVLMDTSDLEVPSSSYPADDSDLTSILINGIQDITNTIIGDFDLNDVLTMIMETMYRGLALNSVLFCIRDGNKPAMCARLGFGEKVDELCREFCFPIDQEVRDVFGLAVTQAKDIHISNAGDLRIRKRLPAWYYGVLGDPAFALFPVIVDKRPFGLFFLSRDRTGSVFDERSLSYLRTLRNQAVLAVKQKRNV